MRSKCRTSGVILIIMFLIPFCAGAATVTAAGDIVFETTGWIIGTDGVNYSFSANVAPFTYLVKLSDLSEAPNFGFDFLYLSITTSTGQIDSIVGPGSFTFDAVDGETYFVNVFGEGAGNKLSGLFGVEITAVPIPTSLLLLGPGLLGLIFLRRRKR